jgi:hypothetical protein
MIRLLVVLSVLAGLAACVMPLYRQTVGKVAFNVSVLNLWQGPDAWREQVGEDAMPADKANDEKISQDLHDVKLLFTGFVAGPAVLVLLFLLLGLRRFGRGLGVLVLLAGLAGLGCWAILEAAIDKVVKEHPEAVLEKGTGLMLLAVCGALAALGGLVALIKPDPKVA